jgi:hypothetical protein
LKWIHSSKCGNPYTCLQYYSCMRNVLVLKNVVYGQSSIHQQMYHKNNKINYSYSILIFFMVLHWYIHVSSFEIWNTGYLLVFVSVLIMCEVLNTCITNPHREENEWHCVWRSTLHNSFFIFLKIIFPPFLIEVLHQFCVFFLTCSVRLAYLVKTFVCSNFNKS